jgi:Carboxypeptidase regulatory-like domain
MITHLMLAASIALAQVPTTGTITGVVRGHLQARGDPLPFAVVLATTAGVERSAVADSLGRYRVEDVPAGLVRLRVMHPGHDSAPLEVVVAAGRTVFVDVDLQRNPIGVEPLTVVAEPILNVPDQERSESPPALPDLSVIALEASPGFGEIGLGEAAATLPGNDPADPSDVLFMRGSTTDLKLVLLDGAPIYTPFHLGGLLKSFDASSLGGAALHVGGAPARYDGGLAYILDLRTRSPRRDRLRGRGSFDLISGSVALEGPLGDRAGFLLSSRTLHDIGVRALGSDRTPYGYGDALGRVELNLGDGHRLTATGFWNRESVFLDLDGVGQGPAPALARPEDASWGNRMLALAYRGGIADVTLDVTAALSGYRADLPLQPSGEDAEAFIASAGTDRVRITLDASAPLHESRLRFGGLVERVDTRYEARLFDDSEVDGAAGSATGVVVGAYADAVRSLAPELDLRVGLRADGFSTESAVRLAPRIALLWSLGPEALLTVAAGRYHQYTRAADPREELAASGDGSGGVSGPLLTVATADHVVLSLDQRLSSGVRLGLAGFWKGFSGLGESGSTRLRSSGVDVRVLRSGTRGTAWLGYNLTWFWSGADVLGTTSEFAGRQLLSAGLSGSLNNGTGVDLTVAYSAGLPYTSIPFGRTGLENAPGDPDGPTDGGDFGRDPPLPGTPDDGFFRLDVEFFTHLRPEVGGRSVDLKLYLRLLNALDQRDALFYYFEPWRDEALRPLAERTVLPVLGLEWRF